MVLLASKPEEEVRKLFAKITPEGYGGMTALLKTLRKIRTRGYAYVPTRGEHQTLALPLRSNLHMAVGISGRLSEKVVPELLAPLRECIDAIDTAGSKITEHLQ
jgi:DNA-binding IclR family transcriptional regulator